MAVQVHHLNEKRKIGEYYDTLEKIAAEKGAPTVPCCGQICATVVQLVSDACRVCLLKQVPFPYLPLIL